MEMNTRINHWLRPKNIRMLLLWLIFFVNQLRLALLKEATVNRTILGIAIVIMLILYVIKHPESIHELWPFSKL